MGELGDRGEVVGERERWGGEDMVDGEEDLGAVETSIIAWERFCFVQRGVRDEVLYARFPPFSIQVRFSALERSLERGLPRLRGGPGWEDVEELEDLGLRPRVPLPFLVDPPFVSEDGIEEFCVREKASSLPILHVNRGSPSITTHSVLK
jgi:hypothetical protein